MSKYQNDSVPAWKIVFCALFVFLLSGVLISGCNSIRTVQPGFVGVLVRLGASQDEPLVEGLHFVVPFITSVYSIDTRIMRSEARGEAASKDLQTVSGTLVINYHLEKVKVVQLYRQIGIQYEEVVIGPSVQEVFKAAAAEYTAESLITQRQKVSEQIKTLLGTRLEPYGITVDQVNIANFDFSKEFNAAIEAKVTAEQKALQAEKELERYKFEAKQVEEKAKGDAAAVVEKAKAEAESLRMKRDTVTPELLVLNFLEKWDGKLPTTMFGTPPIPVFDTTSKISAMNQALNPQTREKTE